MDDVATETLNYLVKPFKIVLRFAGGHDPKNVAFLYGAITKQ